MITTTGTMPRQHDRFDSLWRIASSGRVTLALLVLLGVVLILAVIFPQLPAGLDSTEAERWLGTAAGSYRGLGATLRALGVFSILEGLGLRILLALLAYNLALRLADQARRVRVATQPLSTPHPFPPGLPTGSVTLTATPETALRAVQEALRPRYPLVASELCVGYAQVYARRHRTGAIGGLLLAVGPLILLLGIIVNSTAGWRTTEIPIATSSDVTLAVAGGLQIQLNSIEGEGAQTTSFLTVAWPDGRKASLSAGYYRPGHVGNLWVVQTATGPALQASAHSGNRTLLLQALTPGGQVSEEIHTPFRQTQTEQAFAIPTRNLAFRVVSYNALPEQGIQVPVFLVEAYRGADPTPVLTQLVENEATLHIDDITIDLRRERHAVVWAAYLPGMVFLVLGALLLIVGGVLVLGWGYIEVWAYLAFNGDTATVTFRAASPLRGRAEAHRLAHAAEARLALHPPADVQPPASEPAAPPPQPSATSGSAASGPVDAEAEKIGSKKEVRPKEAGSGGGR